jgi:hypothetical protein
VGRDRVLLLVVALLLLGVLPMMQTGSSATPQSGLEMGYGPGSLFPIGSGTPVYTSGDELWLMSQLNGTALLSPLLAPQNLSLAVPLEQGVPTRALVFGQSEPQGPWTLLVQGTPYPEVLFFLIDRAEVQRGLNMSAWSLGAGGLSMNFSTSAGTPFYDASACVLGGYDDSAASVPVPASDGGGAVNITKAGDALNVRWSATGNSSFTISAELYYTYSFLAPNSSSTFVSRAVRVQASDAIGLTNQQPAGALGLHSETVARNGEYQLRVFFDGASGLSVSSTNVLVTGGSWVWLGGCQVTPVSSDNFRLLSQLGPDPSNWPREVVLNYRVSGVEGYAIAQVGLNISAAVFTGEPWSVPLAGYRASLTRSAGIARAQGVGATEFVVLGGSSGSFDYSLNLGNQTLFEGGSGTLLPYTVTALQLNVSRLQVVYSVGGAPYQGGTVKVGDQEGELAVQTTDSRGAAVFYLPAGVYNVTASGGGETAGGTVTLTEAQSTALNLGGPGPQNGLGTVELLLAVAAVTGVVLDVTLISARRRRRRVTWRDTPRESASVLHGALAEVVKL